MNNLSNKAMLVKLKRGRFTPDVTDVKATQLVESGTGVTNSGRYRKRVLAESGRFKLVTEAFSAIYTYHREHTFPWTDEGPRLLPSKTYMAYCERMRELRQVAQTRLDDLAANWDAEIAADQVRLGSMFCPEDYPTNIGERFYADLQFLPVPSTGDFRVMIDDADRASLDKAIADAEANVATHMITTLAEPIRKMAEKLAIPIDGKGAKFQNSMISNIQETVQRLEEMNISDDPRVSGLLKVTRTLLVDRELDVKGMRNDPTIRAREAGAAKRVSDTIGELFGV